MPTTRQLPRPRPSIDDELADHEAVGRPVAGAARERAALLVDLGGGVVGAHQLTVTVTVTSISASVATSVCRLRAVAAAAGAAPMRCRIAVVTGWRRQSMIADRPGAGQAVRS